MNRRSFHAWLAAGGLSARSAGAQTTPVARPPLRYLVAAPPGTPPDTLSRLLAQRLAVSTGQPVLVDNRPGAAGTIGLRALSAAAPDGATWGAMALPWLVGSLLLPHAGVDVLRDLEPVALLAHSYALLIVPGDSPLRSVTDLVRRAKERPGELKYSSAGNATPGHLAGKLFERAAGLEMRHIPYRGAAGNVTAVLSGDVDLTFGAPGGFAAHLRSERVRALATAAPRRLAAYPEAPTMAEAGVGGVELSDWQAMVAPRGTPAAWVERMQREVSAILTDGDVRAKLEAVGIDAAPAGAAALSAHMSSESLRWARLVRDTGITVD